MLHKKTKIVAVISGIVFLSCVTAAAFFFHTVQGQKAIYTERNISLAQAKSDQESLRTLMHTLEETKLERESLISRILKEEDVINFLALLESLGAEHGVTLTTDSLKVEPLNETFETLLIHMGAEGTYVAVLHVLELFETLPYQVSIESTQLSNAEGGGTTWKGQFSLRVTKMKKI